MLEKAFSDFSKRCGLAIKAKGGHIQKLLKKYKQTIFCTCEQGGSIFFKTEKKFNQNLIK